MELSIYLTICVFLHKQQIPMNRIDTNFFLQDAVTLAEKLLGKTLVRVREDNTTTRYIITETEAYLGEEDEACHASKGKTARTEIMYAEGGHVYVYLIYGMYWMLNIVSGKEGFPEAVLIRGLQEINGPGRVGKALQLDKSFNGENLNLSQRIWIEPAPDITGFNRSPRIGIDYAGDHWRDKPWRFFITKIG